MAILSLSNLDPEAVFLADDCTEAGTVINDVGLEVSGYIRSENFNFVAGGDLNPGTYYLVVYEWGRRVGDYALAIAVTDSSPSVGTGGPELIEVLSSLMDHLDSDRVDQRK